MTRANPTGGGEIVAHELSTGVGALPQTWLRRRGGLPPSLDAFV